MTFPTLARAALALTVLLGLALGAPRQARAQAPSNDLAAGATPIALDAPVDGTIVGAANNYVVTTGRANNTLGKDVVYRFTAPGRGSYAFRVTTYPQPVTTNSSIVPDVTDWVIYVVDTLATGAGPHDVTATGGTILAAQDITGIRAEEVVYTSTAAGDTVFVVVDQDDANLIDGSFTLTATRLRSEREPNDTPATANPFRSSIVGGSRAPGQGADPDCFALGTPAAAGSRVFALLDAFAAPGPDFELRLVTAGATIEYDDDDGDAFHTGASVAGFAPGPVTITGTAPLIAGAVAPQEPLFLRVNHRTDAIDPYRLHAVVQAPISSATLEAEGNDSIGTANGPGAGAGLGYFEGAIGSSDSDIFLVAPHAAGDVIFLGLDCDPNRDGAGNLDGRLALLDAAGNEVVLVDGNTVNTGTATFATPGTLTATTPEFPGEGLVYVAKDATPLFARVTGASGSTGAYLLSIAINGNRPQIFIDESLADFASTGATNASAAKQAVTVTARSAPPATDLTVSVTGDFRISTSSAGSFATTPLVFSSGAGGTFTATFFVDYLPPTSATPSLGTATAGFPDAVSETAQLRGDLPTVTATGFPLAAFTSPANGTASSSKQILVAGIALGGSPLVVTMSTNFKILDGASLVDSKSFPPNAAGDVPPQVVSLRYLPLAGQGVGPHAGTATVASAGGGTAVVIPLAGRIPSVTLSLARLPTFTAAALFVATAPQTVTVEASNLGANETITITPPASFEAGRSAGALGASAFTVTANASGVLAPTTIFVRYVPTAGTSHAGTVEFAAPGAFVQVVDVTGTVPPQSGGGGGGCVAAGAGASPWAALPWLASIGAALSLRGLRRRAARG